MMHRDYREAGFHVFGLYGADANGVCLCDDPTCKAVYKHPISKGWQHTPEWDEDQISAMEMVGQFDTGFGVLCQGYLIVDVDARNGGVESFQRLNEDLGSAAFISAGLVVRTGSGGGSRHLYFRAPEGVSLQTKLQKYPGIDFKSSGYVVGAGSLHESGERYDVLIGSVHDIVEAPQVLVDLLRKPESHRTTVNDRQVDISNHDLVAMLEHIDPNCDHDQWIKCGMAIHHASSGSAFEIWDEWSAKGSKYPGTKQLSKRWDTFGKSERPVTLGTLAHFAELGGWAWPVEFMSDEFAEGVGTVGLFVPVEEMMSSITKPTWIIKGIIEANSNNLLFGESGAGKSLFALDWAFCIGNGINWHNHKIKQGIVLYIAGEGHRGLTLRMQALFQKYNMPPSNIYFSRKSINFIDEKEASAIVKIVNDMGIKVDLVVIDTLHRNMIGDENKTDDMAKFFKSIELVTKETGAAVITVHHSGHADSDRARGSSSIKAGMDAEFRVAKDGMTTLFSCTKSKDFGAGHDMRFGIKEIELEGEVFFDDDDQKQITSVCLEYIGSGEKVELKKNEQALLSSLRDAINDHGEKTWTPDDGEVMSVDVEAWRPFAYECIGKKNPSRDFNTLRNALKNHGVIGNNGDYWWVV